MAAGTLNHRIQFEWGELVKDSFIADETDHLLVHALQLAPRASWEYIGALLDIDPVTLARRWRRLHENGAARITAVLPVTAPHDFMMAFVDLACTPSRTVEIGRTLAHEPRVQTLHTSTGEYDLQLTVYTADLADLGKYLTERVGQIAGVHRMRSHVVTDLVLPGAAWELRALSPAQRNRLLDETAGPHRAPAVLQGRFTVEDQRVFDELVRDGRITYSALAQRLGVSASTARRRLNNLLETWTIVPRCDIAQHAFGWPVRVALSASTEFDATTVRDRLHQDIPEIRLCANVSGTSDLIFILWLHRLDDVKRLEQQLKTIIPGLRIEERTVLLETVKLASHMLDADGRPRGVVPTNIWSPLPAEGKMGNS